MQLEPILYQKLSLFDNLFHLKLMLPNIVYSFE